MAAKVIVANILFILTPCAAVPIDIKVGVLGLSGFGSPYDLERVGPAIDMGFDKVNAEILNDSYRLVKLEFSYGSTCSLKNNATGISADLFYHEQIAALIGPGCTHALEPTARLAAYWNIPVITGVGDARRFLNKTNFPTLTRLAYCQCRMRSIFGSVFIHFGWKDMTIIYDVNDIHSNVLQQSLAEGLMTQDIYAHVLYYFSQQGYNATELLIQAAKVSRIIILIVPGDHLREFMLKALKLGFINGDFVFMDVELFPFPGNYWGSHDWRRGDSKDPDAKKAFEALLRVALNIPYGPEWKNFTETVKKKSKSMYNFEYSQEEEVNFFVAAFYEAVIYYGIGVNRSLDAGLSYTDGLGFSQRNWNRSFQGIAEYLRIDTNGDRATIYAIKDMDPVTGDFQIVAQALGMDDPPYSPIPGMEIHWPGGRKTPTPNTPRCGFKGDAPICQPPAELPIALITTISVFTGVLLLMLAGFLVYKRVRWETELQNMSWRLNFADLKILSGPNTNRTSNPTLSCDFSTHSRAQTIIPDNQMFTTIGMHKGVMVAVKTCTKKQIVLSRDLLMSLKFMRELQHENLVRFVGASVDPQNIAIITEYCRKGSLQDVLANDSLTLDLSFRLSFLQDLARGMSYLHAAEIRTHGRLTSSNCVLDGRFVLKVTDFGLRCFRDEEDRNDDSNAYYKKLMWRAPELLRSKMPEGGTQKGDVYSFGIIVEEVITRGGPFESARISMSAQEIVKEVASEGGSPFRPILPQSAMPQLHDVAKSAWQEDPNDRPDFQAILQLLRKTTKGKDKNILDSLLNRMEQYANNLEVIVEERTLEVIQEKKRSEELLHEILPKSIATQLIQGKSVTPESYDSVTLYFSDIVGFTTLSSGSTPLQVVSFLNDLYTTFDDVIGNFNVYKVETIGDAYMVVSGLPFRNGNDHVVEISNMSLAVIERVKTFHIKHRPQEHLQVRIGLHSGPVVAGVVGSKMPRFCLFGDTVNTASRMESNSEAMKIHISETTKCLLDLYPGFDVVCRGSIDVKGKGKMTTYWLCQ